MLRMFWLAVGMVGAVGTAWGQAATAPPSQTWTHFGITVNQQDISLREAHEICAGHRAEPSAGFWPEPCQTAEQQYENSGAKAKFDEIERRDEAAQLNSVRGVTGK